MVGFLPGRAEQGSGVGGEAAGAGGVGVFDFWFPFPFFGVLRAMVDGRWRGGGRFGAFLLLALGIRVRRHGQGREFALLLVPAEASQLEAVDVALLDEPLDIRRHCRDEAIQPHPHRLGQPDRDEEWHREKMGNHVVGGVIDQLGSHALLAVAVEWEGGALWQATSVLTACRKPGGQVAAMVVEGRTVAHLDGFEFAVDVSVRKMED